MIRRKDKGNKKGGKEDQLKTPASRKGKKRKQGGHQIEELNGRNEFDADYSKSEGRSKLERDQGEKENVVKVVSDGEEIDMVLIPPENVDGDTDDEMGNEEMIGQSNLKDIQEVSGKIEVMTAGDHSSLVPKTFDSIGERPLPSRRPPTKQKFSHTEYRGGGGLVLECEYVLELAHCETTSEIVEMVRKVLLEIEGAHFKKVDDASEKTPFKL